MKQQKIVKQLMAIGVQRNDAAAFARAYSKIMYAKKEDLFPEIMKPVMPMVGVVHNHRVETIRASSIVNRQMAFPCVGNEEFTTMITERLSDELAKTLIQSGAAALSIKQIDDMRTQYDVTVRVAMPKSGNY